MSIPAAAPKLNGHVNGNGHAATPEVHPTAARRPNAIVVQSENTSYSDEFITSTFTNRGADVTVQDGQFIVNPTAQTYELQTQRAVSKTGCVLFPFSVLSSSVY